MTISSLPPVYRRNRGVALSGQATALAVTGEPGQAAITAKQALGIARDSGSGRILAVVVSVAAALASLYRFKSIAVPEQEVHETARPELL
jgi:hypothetical protein